MMNTAVSIHFLKGVPQSLFVLLLLCSGTGVLHSQAQPADPLRGKVETGLSERVRIEGRPFEHWTIQERMLHYKVPGVQIAVIDQGRIVWVGNYGVCAASKPQAVTADTLFQAASVSKVVTALTVLRLIDQHRFSLESDASALLKSWAIPDPAKPVTVRQLLSHNAAINWPAGESAMLPTGPIPTNLDRLLGRTPALNRPVLVDGVPGSGFRYSNGGYLILGQLVADTTGHQFPDIARKLVLDPLKMHRSTFETFTPRTVDPNIAFGHDNEGTEEAGGWRIVGMGEGGLWTTARDLAQAVLAVQASYKGQDHFLSHDLAAQMLTRQNERWGLGVEVVPSGDNSYFLHDGSTPGYKAKLFGYSSRGQGVVILTNGDRGGELIEELMYSVAAAYGWPDFQVSTRKIISVDPDKLQDFVGSYQMAPGAFATISREGGKLFGQVRGRDKTELLPEAKDRFFMVNGPTVDFVRAQTGEVTELIFDGNFHAKKVATGN
jgi:CubicO group peptidase (beta-lactamase class C family)